MGSHFLRKLTQILPSQQFHTVACLVATESSRLREARLKQTGDMWWYNDNLIDDLGNEGPTHFFYIPFWIHMSGP